MPKGLKGEKHPADVTGAAPANKLTPEQRTEIARKAAASRWGMPQ